MTARRSICTKAFRLVPLSGASTSPSMSRWKARRSRTGCSRSISSGGCPKRLSRGASKSRAARRRQPRASKVKLQLDGVKTGAVWPLQWTAYSIIEEQDMKDSDKRTKLDLDDLLHPAQACLHPSEVVHDPYLTLNEKRAILASWASDACAIEAAPELRSSPAGAAVRFDDIMEALRSLDKQSNADRYRRAVRRNRI